MTLHVAFVEAKGELVNVTVQVLIAGVMIDTRLPALHDGPNAFDAVGRHTIADVFASAMDDRLVVVAGEASIAAVFVSVDSRASLNALPDFGAQRLGIGAIYWPRFGAPAALAHAENCRLTDSAAPRMQLLALAGAAAISGRSGPGGRSPRHWQRPAGKVRLFE